jgi:hypothetical protein
VASSGACASSRFLHRFTFALRAAASTFALPLQRRSTRPGSSPLALQRHLNPRSRLSVPMSLQLETLTLTGFSTGTRPGVLSFGSFFFTALIVLRSARFFSAPMSVAVEAPGAGAKAAIRSAIRTSNPVRSERTLLIGGIIAGALYAGRG